MQDLLHSWQDMLRHSICEHQRMCKVVDVFARAGKVCELQNLHGTMLIDYATSTPTMSIHPFQPFAHSVIHSSSAFRYLYTVFIHHLMSDDNPLPSLHSMLLQMNIEPGSPHAYIFVLQCLKMRTFFPPKKRRVKCGCKMRAAAEKV